MCLRAKIVTLSGVFSLRMEGGEERGDICILSKVTHRDFFLFLEISGQLLKVPHQSSVSQQGTG